MAFAAAGLMRFILLPWILYVFAGSAQSLLPVTAKGSKFFDSSGTQFYIKGMNYAIGVNSQNGEIPDVLANPKQCALDAPLMKTLLVNTIRVYIVDNTQDHTECMHTFEKNGIYVIIDLPTYKTTIDNNNPSWNQELFDAYTRTLSEFSQYDNLLAVYVGNEAINDGKSSTSVTSCNVAPYLKAAARDVKAYRDAQKMRKIPIGYSAADIDAVRTETRDYLTCGGDNTTTIDFFAINNYAWCGPSSFTASGYSELYNDSLDSPVPIFFSETGCTKVGNRSFDDQVAVLGPQMNTKWSGAMIYEWGETENHYGIVSYPSDITSVGSSTVKNYGTSGTPTPITPDFYNLQSQWDTLTPTGVSGPSYTFTGSTPACPTSDSGGAWTVDASASLPTIKNLVIPTKTESPTNEAAATASQTSGSSALPRLPSPNPSSSGLSTGTKAVIGVVIPLAVIALIALVFLLWRRKKARSAAAETTDYTHVPQMQEHNRGADGFPPAQLHGDDARVEPDSRARYQLSDEATPVPELRGDREVAPQELSSGPSVRRNPLRRRSYEAP